MSSRFHLAIPVRSIVESKQFYCEFLGCEEGNCEEGKWQDINFWGNELTLHNAGEDELTHSHRHHVDMADVCVPPPAKACFALFKSFTSVQLVPL